MSYGGNGAPGSFSLPVSSGSKGPTGGDGAAWSPRRPADPASSQRSFGGRMVRLERSDAHASGYTSAYSPGSNASRKMLKEGRIRAFPRASRWSWATTCGVKQRARKHQDTNDVATLKKRNEGQHIAPGAGVFRVHQAVDDVLGEIDPVSFSVRLFSQLGSTTTLGE